jgi:formylglycine-generating enzyme required for sulfatase activity
MEVGFSPANNWGIYDMHGNVSEWCEDGWHLNYYLNAPHDGSVWLGGDTSLRVLRGGSWYSTAPSLRSANRAAYRSNCRL